MILGVTGLTGAGKGFLSGRIAERHPNAFVIDCDKVYHGLINPGSPCWTSICEYFDVNVILNKDGTINRKVLGQIVFSDSQKLTNLTAITHSHIFDAIESILEFCGDRLYIIDSPLLFESGLCDLCDQILIAEASAEIRLQRIMKRDNITQEYAERRMNSQKYEYPEGDNITFVNTEGDWWTREIGRILESIGI